jgi:hypothetical protein
MREDSCCITWEIDLGYHGATHGNDSWEVQIIGQLFQSIVSAPGANLLGHAQYGLQGEGRRTDSRPGLIGEITNQEPGLA